MSTQTQVQTLLFGQAEVRKMPRKICVGRVAMVGEGHMSKSGVWVVQPFEIQGLGASMNITYYLLYKPFWMVPGFAPDSLPTGSTEESLYRRHIAVKKALKGTSSRLSGLEGLSGSPENWIALQSAILGAAPNIDYTNEDCIGQLQEVLRDFFSNQDEVEIGYVLKQGSEKTDETNENGKPIYQLTERYEVDSFFFPTPDQLAYYRTKAAASKGTTIVCFDDETPF